MKNNNTFKYSLQTYYSRIFKTYDLLNRLFTFGFDRKWRWYTVKACLDNNPKRILDLCCGTGDMTIALKKKSNNTVHVTGFDLNAEMLDIARQKATRSHVMINFIRGDVVSMPFENGEYDSITMSFGFRNLIWKNYNQNKHISEISRIMKPDASLFILESGRPGNKLVFFFYNLYLKFYIVPLGGILSGQWQAYRYLVASSEGFYNLNELRDLLKQNQLEICLHRSFLFGSVNLYIAKKKKILCSL